MSGLFIWIRHPLDCLSAVIAILHSHKEWSCKSWERTTDGVAAGTQDGVDCIQALIASLQSVNKRLANRASVP